VTEREFGDAGKKLYEYFLKKKLLSQNDIFSKLCSRNSSSVADFAGVLERFLNKDALGSGIDPRNAVASATEAPENTNPSQFGSSTVATHAPSSARPSGSNLAP
jgi:hypothetical protein